MKRFLLVFVALVLIIFAGLSIFLFSNLQPVAKNIEQKNFVINQGESLTIIGERLEKNHLIKNKYVFIAYAYYLGLNRKIQAGTFSLSPSWSTQNIIDKLSKGGSHDYWLVIKDGSRKEEIALSLPPDAAFKPAEFLTYVKTKEGRLYPDKYRVPSEYTVPQVLDLIDKNYQKKISQAKLNPENQDITEYQTLILASLLEREGKSLESKKMVAGIVLNRLKTDMALQIDATVQYARDTQNKPEEYWQPLSQNDLTINSLYNTYKNRGLPPGPICNPGENSIFAAYHPSKSDYLFYITGNDGKMYYAKTLEEHNKNIEKYLK